MAEERVDCAEGLKVEITNDVLTYSICERTGEFEISKTFNDTVWVMERNFYKVKFRQSSIDSIVNVLDTLQGKYVYATNPYVMSGSITNFYIQYDHWCSEFSLKNTYDSTAFQITNIINSYLTGRNRIYIPQSRWENNQFSKPLIKPCPSKRNGSYKEALEQEYEVIRKK